MNLSQAIRDRRAVRDFTTDAVPRDMLFQLVSAASWAPSAMNEQPWRFTIITDRALLDLISERAKAWQSARQDGLNRTDHFRDLFSDPGFHLFYHAPALIVIAAPAQTWATEDCALAAQNLMLAATELGLGSCWIGFAQGWLASPEGRDLLSLGAGEVVVAPIAIGWPKGLPPPVPRKAITVSWIGPRDARKPETQPWAPGQDQPAL
jgi:nitroreductase